MLVTSSLAPQSAGSGEEAGLPVSVLLNLVQYLRGDLDGGVVLGGKDQGVKTAPFAVGGYQELLDMGESQPPQAVEVQVDGRFELLTAGDRAQVDVLDRRKPAVMAVEPCHTVDGGCIGGFTRRTATADDPAA